MGLKDLKAPIELLEYAKTVVSERKMVEEKLSALKPASKAPSCKNETAYSDLKRLIRILDPSLENSSAAKRVKLEDNNNDESDRVGGGKKANGSASPSSTLKDLQKSQQEQLRGFKIPKSSNGNGNTSSSSSSNNGASKTSSSLSSSSKNQGSNSSNSYYHPKKNHYMMYMMENKACTTQQTSPSEFR